MAVSFSGDTICANDSARVGAGVFYLDASVATWTGETNFVDHSASFYGGTILARFYKTSWSGVTSFKTSEFPAVLESGGTVLVEDPVLSWHRETIFHGGSGVNGELFMPSDVLHHWGGVNNLFDNIADISGGTIHTATSFRVPWTGQTHIFNNRVYFEGSIGQDGGAIFVADSVISWNRTTTFPNKLRRFL